MGAPTIELKREHWRLDKAIPIPMLIAFAIQLGSGLWYVQGVVKDTASNTQRINALESQRTAERVIALETESQAARASAIRIEANLIRIESSIASLAQERSRR